MILNPKNKNYKETLNGLNDELKQKYGEYPFFDYFEFNDELLEFYTKLKENYSVNIFTTGTIQNIPEVRKRINPIFDNIFTAKDFNLNKKNPQAFLFIADKLKKKPEEIIFIDDQKENVDAAEETGMKVIVYHSNSQLFSELTNLL